MLWDFVLEDLCESEVCVNALCQDAALEGLCEDSACNIAFEELSVVLFLC